MVRLVTGEGEGSMAEMFRHALTDFPQWSPTALSLDPPIIQARTCTPPACMHSPSTLP